jgi:DNA modification methylase
MIGISEEIIKRNNELIRKFKTEFEINNEPIEVKFRELIPELKSGDRYTHLIHSYPAKLLVHIPYFFLNNTVFSKKGDNILDPFNGSGTVYLEGLLSGRNVYGADSNPLAKLIAKVKSTKYETKILEYTLSKLINDVIESDDKVFAEVVNCDLWFSSRTKNELSRLLFQIKKIEDNNIRDFMLMSFSNCVKKASYADPRISVPVKLNAERYNYNIELKEKILKKINEIDNLDVIQKFESITMDNIKKFKRLELTSIEKNQLKHISNDARCLYKNEKELIDDNSIQLIVTSPPYAGAQKYIRSSSLNLGWTQLANVSELRILDKKNIGREIYAISETNIIETEIKEADDLINKVKLINKSRANIVCQYIIQMKKAIDEMIRVLKNEGFLIIVIGNNKVCNYEFNTQEYLTTYIIEKGLKLEFKLIDSIKSYGLMTKRNKTADIISREYILVFKK